MSIIELILAESMLEFADDAINDDELYDYIDASIEEKQSIF